MGNKRKICDEVYISSNKKQKLNDNSKWSNGLYYLIYIISKYFL